MTSKAKNTGLFLILLGIVFYVISGRASVTALIPSFFGLVYLILGFLSAKENLRKHVMHILALISLLGIFGSIKGLITLPSLLTGSEVARPLAVISQSIMCVVLVLFLISCIRSFIDARKNKS